MQRAERIHERGRPPHPDVLTPAEFEVLGHLERGLNNRAIARARGTTMDAVKFHLANIRSKLQLSDRDELGEWARSQRMRAKDPMVVIYVADRERAGRFYTEALGFETVVDEPNGFLQLACDGLRLGLHPWRGFEGLYQRTGKTSAETNAESWDRDWAPATTLHLGVADVDAACRAVQAAGGTLVRVADKPWGDRLAEVVDTEGNPFELSGPTSS